MTVDTTGSSCLPPSPSRHVRTGITLLVLGLFEPGCATDSSTIPPFEELGVSADLTLAAIDGGDLPYDLDSTDATLVEVLSGNLNLQESGRFQRQTTTRTTSQSTQQADVSSVTDAGSYTLVGESLTLLGSGGTLGGTLQGERATLLIDGRAWVYR